MSNGKVGIISRHAISNYGSLLQAYALESVIAKNEYSALTIHYVPKCEKGIRLALSMADNQRQKYHGIKRVVFLLYQFPSVIILNYRFNKYRTKWLHMTKECNDEKELRDNCQKFDILCTGSDQVWNRISNGQLDPCYFLSFSSPRQRCISYAASFGGKEILEGNKETLKGLLNKYEIITVREKNGLEVLKAIQCDGENVLDPTLLIEKKDWESKCKIEKRKKPYILIYQLKRNQEFDRIVNEIAKDKSCDIIRVSTMFFQVFKAGKYFFAPPPENVLGLIRNAKLVITDSFHATVFSLVFNTPFLEVLPGRFNARNLSLLEMTDLRDRIVNYDNFRSVIQSAIDWDNVNNIISNQRARSYQKLISMLKGKKECESNE